MSAASDGDALPPSKPGPAGNNKQRYQATQLRKKTVLALLAEGRTIKFAAGEVGVTPETVRNWRSLDSDFRAEMDAIREELRKNSESGEDNFGILTPGRKDHSQLSFPGFRLRFFKRATPLFQQEIARAYDELAPGNILLVLMPPEHGKTTMFEDYVCRAFSYNPDYRVTLGSETQNLGKRIIQRIKHRMEPAGPYPTWAKTFGPFVPQTDSERSTRQPWSAEYFNIYKKGDQDERDYSMMAIGFNAAVAGTRTDHLHCDDLQSMRTLSQTQKMLDTFRQDWLTRPGERGKTTINGTRVGDGDFYEGLIEQFEDDPILKVVKLPAIVRDYDTGEDRPLWPYDAETGSGYTMEMLERLRKKVGEDAWSRNYMQSPRAVSFGTFTREQVEACYNPMRTIHFLPVQGAPVYLTVDPALGGKNCIMAIQVTPEKLYVVDVVEDTGLRQNEQIMTRIESMVLKVRHLGGSVTDVIIETKNFQAGLGRDERLMEMSRTYGFSLREHLTGVNKYDPDVGVPSMATSFLKQQIDLPFADDMATRNVTSQLTEQLLKWRPFIRGNKLRQDQVMALWFGWILWENRRKAAAVDTDSFRAQGIPWSTTPSGLVVPTAGSPFYRKR